MGATGMLKWQLKKRKRKKKQSTKNSQVGICYKLQTYKYVGGKRVGVVYGDRKIHNSLEGQNSTVLLYLR